MDLIRLDEDEYFIPIDTIEGWKSLIWTERFRNVGEFELKTHRIEQTMLELPELSYVAIQESEEIMQVETHSIADTADGPELTIRGRAFAPILFMNRPVRDGSSVQVNWFITPDDFVDVILTRFVENNIEVPNDNVDGVRITKNITRARPERHIRIPTTLEQQDVWTYIGTFLDRYNFGIRTIRPIITPTTGLVTIEIQIYDGQDRTATQTARDEIVFNYEAGHIKSPTYLKSSQKFKNIAYVNAPIGFSAVYGAGGLSATGADRRILAVNASDLDSPGNDTITGALYNRGMDELAKANKEHLFDGEITPLAPYIWRPHIGSGTQTDKEYFLGDKVTLQGPYGSEDMFVAEYIRVDGPEGSRAYPTLATRAELD
jgi:hypothetical protein